MAGWAPRVIEKIEIDLGNKTEVITEAPFDRAFSIPVEKLGNGEYTLRVRAIDELRANWYFTAGEPFCEREATGSANGDPHSIGNTVADTNTERNGDQDCCVVPDRDCYCRRRACNHDLESGEN